jgi:hypothetical protein
MNANEIDERAWVVLPHERMCLIYLGIVSGID